VGHAPRQSLTAVDPESVGRIHRFPSALTGREAARSDPERRRRTTSRSGSSQLDQGPSIQLAGDGNETFSRRGHRTAER